MTGKSTPREDGMSGRVVIELTREQANALLVAAMAGRPPMGDTALEAAINALNLALSWRPS